MFTFTNSENLAGFKFYREHLHSPLGQWILKISIFLQAEQPDGGSAIKNLIDAASF